MVISPSKKIVYHDLSSFIIILPIEMAMNWYKPLPSIRDRNMIKNLLDKSTPSSFLLVEFEKCPKECFMNCG
jgi:hypothetical protein